MNGLVIHAAHAAAKAMARRRRLFLLRNLGDETLRGQEQARDGCGILERGAGDLFRIHHAGFHEVFKFAGRHVVAFVALAFLDFFDNHRAFDAGVVGQRADRGFDRPLDDVHTDALVVVAGFDAINRGQAAKQGHATARDDALFDGCAGRVQRVFHAGLLLLHLGLGGGTDVDDGHAASELRQTFLQFLTVVVARRLLDLPADLIHAALDFRALAVAFDDGGVFLVHHDGLGAAEVGDVDVLQLDAEVFRDALAAREDGDVFKHGLATVAEARGLHRAHVQRATQFVDHEGGQRFAFDFFRDDEQRLAGARRFLQEREQVFEAADFLFVDEDVGVLHLGSHPPGVGHDVRREITLVELHALNDFERGLDGLGFLDGDRAVLADLVHGLGDDLADGVVPVRRNRGDLLDFLLVLHLFGDLVELGDRGLDGFADATLNPDRVCTRGDELEAFAINGLRQHGRRGGTVARGVARLAGDFADHLRAHVFVRVFQFNFLRDRDAVLGHGRGTEFFVENDVAAFGAQGRGDGPGEFGNAPENRLTRGLIEYELFCCHTSWFIG